MRINKDIRMFGAQDPKIYLEFAIKRGISLCNQLELVDKNTEIISNEYLIIYIFYHINMNFNQITFPNLL